MNLAQPISLRLPVDLQRELESVAKHCGVSLSHVIREAIKIAYGRETGGQRDC